MGWLGIWWRLRIWKWWKHSNIRAFGSIVSSRIEIAVLVVYSVLSHEVCEWGLVRMLDAWQFSVAWEFLS